MAKQDGPAERVDTKRIVLRRERVIVLPEALTGEAFEKTKADIAKAVGLRAGSLKPVVAWVAVGEFEGANMTRAIEAHAGKPGTPDAIPGTYKAPSVRAWAGGEEYVMPPSPKVERKALVDG